MRKRNVKNYLLRAVAIFLIANATGLKASELTTPGERGQWLQCPAGEFDRNIASVGRAMSNIQMYIFETDDTGLKELIPFITKLVNEWTPEDLVKHATHVGKLTATDKNGWQFTASGVDKSGSAENITLYPNCDNRGFPDTLALLARDRNYFSCNIVKKNGAVYGAHRIKAKFYKTPTPEKTSPNDNLRIRESSPYQSYRGAADFMCKGGDIQMRVTSIHLIQSLQNKYGEKSPDRDFVVTQLIDVPLEPYQSTDDAAHGMKLWKSVNANLKNTPSTNYFEAKSSNNIQNPNSAISSSSSSAPSVETTPVGKTGVDDLVTGQTISKDKWSKESVNNASVDLTDSGVYLRVFRTSYASAALKLGSTSRQHRVSFDWEIQTDGWWEGAGVSILNDSVKDFNLRSCDTQHNCGKVILSAGGADLPIKYAKTTSGRYEATVDATSLVFFIVPSGSSANGDHGNTFFRIKNLKVD
jgi:hypothetical protein